MKLLVVASTFPSGDADPVPAFVRDQLIALKRQQPDLDIAVLAPHDPRSETQDFRSWPAYDEFRFHYFWPRSAETLTGRGILPAIRANPLKLLLVPFLFLGELRALSSLTKQLEPDVIYAHWFTPQGVVASCVGRRTGTPFVFTTHAADVDVWRRIPVLGRLIVRRGTRRARAFTAVSRRSMQKLERFFAADELPGLRRKSVIIPMGVALPDATAPMEPPASDRIEILFLGRLAEKKGVRFLLEAYAAARHRIGNSRLTIAGDGPLRAELERQAAGLGLGDEVRFSGFVGGRDKLELLNRADVFVVPSIVTAGGDAEGMPVALMEGLAHGRVCVATHESGADDILTEGRDGFLIPQQDAAALSRALIDAAGLDAARRRELEANARETAKQFDWASIAERHYDFLFRPFES